MLKQTKKTGVHLVVATMIAFGLAACGGGGGGGSTVSTASNPANTPSTPSTPSAGGFVLGSSWTVRDSARPWHWVANNGDGSVIVAGEGPNSNSSTPSNLYTSRDGGATFTTFASTGNFTWIAADVSASGDRIVAAEYGGGLYISNDRGLSFTRVTNSPLVNAAGGLPFESVTISADGTRIAAVIQNGGLVYSNSNSGGMPTSWAAATGTGAAQPWRAVDSSADGSVVVAASHTTLYVCSNGTTLACTPTPVTPTGSNTAVNEGWYRTKISADGKTIALAANSFSNAGPGTGVYLSRDSGANWTKPVALTADFTALAMSDNAQSIGVTLSTTGSVTGRVLVSNDGGTTFGDVSPAADPNWRAMAISRDGTHAVAAAGLFMPSTNGRLYTSP